MRQANSGETSEVPGGFSSGWECGGHIQIILALQ